MFNKYNITISLFVIIFIKKYIYNEKKKSSKKTQTDLTIKKITQLEEFENDLVTIYNNEYHYKWKYIDYDNTNNEVISNVIIN